MEFLDKHSVTLIKIRLSGVLVICYRFAIAFDNYLIL